MGRAYHGNVMDHFKAVNRVSNQGCIVTTEVYFKDSPIRTELLTITLSSPEGSLHLTSKSFDDHDEDVLLNKQAEWLNRIAEGLEYWKQQS